MVIIVVIFTTHHLGWCMCKTVIVSDGLCNICVMYHTRWSSYIRTENHKDEPIIWLDQFYLCIKWNFINQPH